MEFVDPPKTKRTGSRPKWLAIVNELKAQPGEWAKVGNFSPGVPTQIRNGAYPAFLPADYDGDQEAYMRLHWEVTTRSTTPGRLDVWVRWLG
jgi:hypothetical protein